MQHENIQYEDQLDLLVVITEILRKWKLILLAAVVGAVLLGAYSILGPASNSGLQQTIQANYTKHYKAEAEIRLNEATISADLQKIAAYEELLETQEQVKGAQEDMLDTLQASLAQIQAVLENQELSPEQVLEISAQLTAVTDRITEINDGLTISAQAAWGSQELIAEWQEEADSLSAKNIPLIHEDERLLAYIAGLEASLTSGEDSGSRIKSAVEYALFGAVLGALAVCGVAFLQCIMSKKLRAASELSGQYQMPVLGELSAEKTHSRGMFNKALDKLTNHKRIRLDEKQAYELIAARIQSPAIPAPVHLAVTGTVDAAMLHTVGDELRTLLPKDYTVTVVENPLYNVDFMVNLKQYAVLFVEAKGISDKREIARLAEILRRNEVKILGAVVK